VAQAEGINGGGLQDNGGTWGQNHEGVMAAKSWGEMGIVGCRNMRIYFGLSQKDSHQQNYTWLQNHGKTWILLEYAQRNNPHARNTKGLGH